MSIDTVREWRWDIRHRIDGLQLYYEGIGEHQFLYATAYQTPCNGRRMWLVATRDSRDEMGIEYTYGETMPLTRKMAEEVALRFVQGKKIPKRLEWR